LAFGLALGGIATWLALRDPLGALPRAEGPLNAVPERPERRDGRLIRHYVLRGSALGPIGFTVDLPDPLPNRRLPVLIVVGGLNSGAKNLRHVPPSGANAFIGYDWPLPRKLPKGPEFLRAAPGLYRRVLAVPGQVAATVGWLAGQPWAEAERISLLGFSLGALVAPAAQRVAQASSHRIGWTVLAYGGADLGRMLAEHPKAELGPAKPLLGMVANLLLRPIEPAEHLPHLTGRFLLIGGSDDRLVPRPSAERMRALTPEPKSVVLLEGAHIGTGARQQALLADIVRLTGTWLVEQGAVNAP
jgi:pimeloyl-ACP methyl ester carboxylesterase